MQEPTDNEGNFIAIIRLLAKSNPGLEDHLEHGPQNARCTSKTIQNEVIAVMANLRECLCKSGPADFAGDTDLAHFLCVVRHSCTYTKTTIRLTGSLYFSEFYGN